MKVSCNQGLASRVGPESCGDGRKVVVEALTGESAGRVLSLENHMLQSADALCFSGRQQRMSRYCEGYSHSAWSETLRTHRSISRARRSLLSQGGSPGIGSREIPGLAWMVIQVRAMNPQGERWR